MSTFFSFFSSTPEPKAPPPPEPEKTPKKTSTKRAQLIALKSTGSGGLKDDANVGRRKVLV